MEEEIKELKELRLAREIAMNYDYVPELGMSLDVNRFFAEGLDQPIDLDTIERILKQYSGLSPDRIENRVFDIIENLK